MSERNPEDTVDYACTCRHDDNGGGCGLLLFACAAGVVLGAMLLYLAERVMGCWY